MPATVLLIRHPESVWNRQGVYQGQKDPPLSPLGRLQAERVAARLRREPLSGVVCSPLRRAQTLAQAIGRHHGLTPEVDPRLTEIAHGPWEGLTRHQVQEQYPELYSTWQHRPCEVTFPGGESLQDVQDRCIAPVEALLSRIEQGTWVVVTHDIVARLVIAAAQGFAIQGFEQVEVENAAITTLVGPTLMHSVRRVNDVDHLGEHRVNLGAQAL